jgi:hypothetical protein
MQVPLEPLPALSPIIVHILYWKFANIWPSPKSYFKNFLNPRGPCVPFKHGRRWDKKFSPILLVYKKLDLFIREFFLLVV